jgi:hypothetical protein
MTPRSERAWQRLRKAAENDPRLSATDVAVFKLLLDEVANYDTAEPMPWAAPTQREIARRIHRSLRQVQYSLGHLQRHGWLIASGTTGPGTPRHYRFARGARCDCEGWVHVPERSQVLATELSQGTVARAQVNSRFVPEYSMSPPTGTNSQDQQLRVGDRVECPFCGAEGVVGERLIEHKPDCWRGGMLALYSQEPGS